MLRHLRAAAAVLSLGCTQETFELLPHGMPDAGASMSSGGSRGQQPPLGGAGGMLRVPDCPPWDADCRSCAFPSDCLAGETCDRLGNYCTPACSTNFECSDPARWLCDLSRGSCVECTFNSHCPDQGPWGSSCERGSCIPIECFTNQECFGFELRPVCESNVCRACRFDRECGFGWQCLGGDCERNGPPPQPSPRR